MRAEADGISVVGVEWTDGGDDDGTEGTDNQIDWMQDARFVSGPKLWPEREF